MISTVGVDGLAAGLDTDQVPALYSVKVNPRSYSATHFSGEASAMTLAAR